MMSFFVVDQVHIDRKKVRKNLFWGTKKRKEIVKVKKERGKALLSNPLQDLQDRCGIKQPAENEVFLVLYLLDSKKRFFGIGFVIFDKSN
jgi:hypothetical protein